MASMDTDLVDSDRRRFVAASNEEVEPLRDLVREGRLFDVQQWIADGKPLEYPPSKAQSALQIAVCSGFHSMVQVLLEAWPTRDGISNVLGRAHGHGYAHIVPLLLNAGADPNRLRLGDVAEFYDGNVMRLFLDHGIDTSDRAIAEAMTRMARPVTGCLKELVASQEDGVYQASMALRWFIQQPAERRSYRWIGLSLWIGADPRMKTWSLDGDHKWSVEESAMEAACSAMDLKALKMLKPSKATDDLDYLLTKNWDANSEITDYLYSLGASINNKPNGGSTLLDRAITRPSRSRYDRRLFVAASELEELRDRGARLVPDDESSYRTMRKAICDTGASNHARLFQAVADVTDDTVFYKLIRTSTVRAYLGESIEKALKRYGKTQPPPEPKTERRRSIPVSTSKGKAKNTAQPAEQVDEPEVPEEPLYFDLLEPGSEPSEPIPTYSIRSRRVNVRSGQYTTLSRGDLYKRVWETSTRKLAREFGISDVGLAKICKAYHIPRPPRGYWAKVRNGHPQPQTPLPNPEDQQPVGICGYKAAHPDAAEHHTRAARAEIRVVDLLTDPHPLIRQTERARIRAEQAKGGDAGDSRTKNSDPAIRLRLSDDHRDRGYRILDAILRALETRGCGILPVRRGIRFNRGSKRTYLELIEHEPGVFSVQLDHRVHGLQHTWNDGKVQRLESVLGQIVTVVEKSLDTDSG